MLSDFNLSLIDLDGPEGCWLFTRHTNAKGYSKIAGQSGHRVIWREFVDPDLPRDVDLDHLCGNRACVNPDHLEPVPHYVNVRRRHGWTLGDDGVWTCAVGHRVEGEDAYGKPGGRVECRPCRRKRSRDFWNAAA